MVQTTQPAILVILLFAFPSYVEKRKRVTVASVAEKRSPGHLKEMWKERPGQTPAGLVIEVD